MPRRAGAIDRLGDSQPGWLAAGVALELLSCLSCPRMSWRSAYELGMSELAVGSVVPASGAAGLVFGAWALRRGGMRAREIARRSAAFFVLKSAANFIAVAVVGLAMWLGALQISGALKDLVEAPDLAPSAALEPRAIVASSLGLIESYELLPEILAHAERAGE